MSERNGRYGLHFMFSHRCAYRDNRFVRNGAGVAVMYTREVAMERNEFHANRGATAYGLLLKDISDSRLESNRFSDNSVGLLIEGGGRLVVERNRFTRNGWAVRLMANSPQNRFARNVFEGNSFDMATNSRTTDADVSATGGTVTRATTSTATAAATCRSGRCVSSRCSCPATRRRSFSCAARSSISLDAAERALPVLTPDTLVDKAPLMAIPQ